MKRPEIPPNEKERLAALDSYRVLDTEPEDRFDELVAIASAVCETPIALVSLVDASRQWFLARRGLDATETPRDLSFCGHAVHAGAPLIVRDARSDQRFHDNPLVTGDPNVCFYAGMPLIDGEGHALGTLCVIDNEPRTLDERQLRVLDALARQTVRLLEGTRRRWELEEAHAARAQMESQTNRFFDLGYDLLAIVGFDGTFKRLSSSWSTLLGVPLEELVGQPFIDVVHPEDRETTLAVAGKVMSGGVTADFRNRNRRVDGSYVWLEWSGNADPEASLMYAVARDVTAQQNLERMKSEFVATVSHELRTPLTSIRGALGLVIGGALGEVPEEAQEVLEVASNNATRLGHILNDILDVERIESLKMQLSMEPVDLHEALAQAQSGFDQLAKHAGIRIVVDGPGTRCEMSADPGRIRQVLDNLLSNAMKYSEPGHEVRLVLLPCERGWRVEVRDQGPGVPMAFQHRLFERFAQADPRDQRARGGSGLGLHICRGIVEGHHGEIGYTQGEQGSTFWLEFPSSVQVSE